MFPRILLWCGVAALAHGCDCGTEVTDAGPIPPPSSEPALTGLRVRPESVALDPGARAQFSVVGTLANGESAAVAAAWDAGGGTVN
ncbi:MAG TPA: hypothetical protein VNO52_13080, partial [Methylomirabilota bacterium]|nr:hypothetical protein [Methylomirabilota bacterium]